jgi:hypothetical protein
MWRPLNGRAEARRRVYAASAESAPPGQAQDNDPEDGARRRKRENEGKRQYRDTEHLIHWWLLTVSIGRRNANLRGARRETQIGRQPIDEPFATGA